MRLKDSPITQAYRRKRREQDRGWIGWRGLYFAHGTLIENDIFLDEQLGIQKMRSW